MIISILRYGSDIKQYNTAEPLIYGDLFQYNHISIALKYVPYPILWTVIAVSMSIIVLAVCRAVHSFHALSGRRYWPLVKLLTLALAISLGRYLAIPPPTFVNFPGIQYYGWNWPANVAVNGLVLHLIQTSDRPAPEELSPDNRAEFAIASSQIDPAAGSPRRFMMILCESCWNNDRLFRDEFKPLLDLKPVEMRGVSPVFGAGTPNATLELLSGLPTNNPAVAGIIYQEYRDYFGYRTATLPSYLAESGYQTVSAHDFMGQFWFRRLVEPKLGFEEFYGSEEMLPGETLTSYPHDKVLFDWTSNWLHERRDVPVFLHLATVHTHGPYEDVGDGGTHDYSTRLRDTISSMARFVDETMLEFPDAVILVYGDHKPALGMLEKYRDAGEGVAGDTPILVFDADRARARKLKSRADGKPFFCYGGEISKIYFSIILPESRYTNSICSNYSADKYDVLSSSVPSWVYSAALFDKNGAIGHIHAIPKHSAAQSN